MRNVLVELVLGLNRGWLEFREATLATGMNRLQQSNMEVARVSTIESTSLVHSPCLKVGSPSLSNFLGLVDGFR